MVRVKIEPGEQVRDGVRVGQHAGLVEVGDADVAQRLAMERGERIRAAHEFARDQDFHDFDDHCRPRRPG